MDDIVLLINLSESTIGVVDILPARPGNVGLGQWFV